MFQKQLIISCSITFLALVDNKIVPSMPGTMKTGYWQLSKRLPNKETTELSGNKLNISNYTSRTIGKIQQVLPLPYLYKYENITFLLYIFLYLILQQPQL